MTFTHLENEWLQPLVDLGAPAGLLLVGTLGLVWLAAARRRDLSSVEVGLLAGTAAVAAQNLVDFSLEFAGVGVPFMVALGLLTRGEWGGAAALGAGWLAARWRCWAWRVAGALVLAGPPDRRRGRRRGPRAHRRRGRACWPRRRCAGTGPTTCRPPRSGARWVLEGRCAPAMPWLTRAMALNPTAPEPHQYAARCLAAAGQDALARREYRLAVLYGSPSALAEAADRYQAVDELLQVVPDTGDGLIGLGYLLLSRQRPADAALVFRRALDGLARRRGRWCRWPGRCWPPASWRRRSSTPSAAPARRRPTRRAGGWRRRC